MPMPAPPAEGDGDPESVAVIPTTLGTRNFEQVNGTMSAVTGIEGNTTVTSRYNTLKSQLPSDNDIKSFNFSGQIGITVLAAEYCNALVNNAAYATQRAAALGTIDLNATPTVALNTAGRAAVAQALITKFWGTGLNSMPNLTNAQNSIVTLIGELVAGETNNAATTKKVVVGACTSVLASSPVTLL
jgi:hypothetical protein